ncbi:MAG TPA: hypothetical protein VL651_08140 [Bacteroidia bacterium]|jgi:tetratricopeptide (TPR) repeat protein|nr:hypothetical protein [Bacteroidia bacterium]
MRSTFSILILLTLFTCCPGGIHAQRKTYNMDSLWKVYNDKTKPDTIRMRALQNYAWQSQIKSLDSCLAYASVLHDYAKRVNSTKFLGYAENDMAVIYKKKTLYAVAMEHSRNALDDWTAVHFDSGIVVANKNIGGIMYNLSDSKRAVEYWTKALTLAQQIHFADQITSLYLSIGHLYLDERKDTLALDYFFRARRMLDSLHDEKGLMLDDINIGAAYGNMGLTDSSIAYLNAATRIGHRLHSTEELVTCYDDIAYAFIEKGELKRALDSCRIAMKYADTMRTAKDYLLVSQCMRSIFDAMHNSDSAYKYFKAVVLYEDSVNRDDQLGIINQKESEFRYQKKAQADSLTAVASKQLSDAELASEKKTSYFLFAGIALVILFAGFIFNRLRVTQKQKIVIEQQRKEAVEIKEIIEEKNREITDSIQYARRIQRSHLPSEKYIERNLERLRAGKN